MAHKSINNVITPISDYTSKTNYSVGAQGLIGKLKASAVAISSGSLRIFSSQTLWAFIEKVDEAVKHLGLFTH